MRNEATVPTPVGPVRYVKGERVVLISSDDDIELPLRPGTTGTVIRVDDAGVVHVKWDSNVTLGMGPRDEFRHLTGAELAAELYRAMEAMRLAAEAGRV